jgi:hypothetical protein
MKLCMVIYIPVIPVFRRLDRRTVTLRPTWTIKKDSAFPPPPNPVLGFELKVLHLLGRHSTI